MSRIKKRGLVALQAWIVLDAILCFSLAVHFFERPQIGPASLFNAGVDVMGSVICAVLFFGCLGQMEERTHSFLALLMLTSLAFVNNEISWFLSGMPRYRFAILAVNAATKLFDFALVYCFYRYVRLSLGFKGKFSQRMDHFVRWAAVPFVLLVIVNLFVPICFGVDAEGVFRMGKWYRLVDVYLVLVAPPTAVLIAKSSASAREKGVALSFIIVPILHYLSTSGAHGYATQYASVTAALGMLFCVLFYDRGRSLTAAQTELRMGTRIQSAMLPATFPAFPDRAEFDLYAVMAPAREVGGDFYDFFLIDEDHLCIVMADVSGKGVPAALFMMASKIHLQSIAMMGCTPAEILEKTNEAICAHNDAKMFVTVWLGILTISTGQMTCANAGHEYPLLRRAGGRYELYKDRHGFVLGGLQGMRYREYTLSFAPGDQMYLYTDGVTEATNAQKELFGTDRLLESLNSAPEAQPGAECAHVRKAVDAFVGDASQFDDMTMLCFAYRGPGKTGDGRGAE